MKREKNIPMASAPFIYNEKGEVMWDRMWDTFCYLAVEGGPPHRETKLVKERETDTKADEYKESVRQILRAFRMLTNYKCTEESGWIRVNFLTFQKAKWFAWVINSENVECRVEGRSILLPVNNNFTLEKEIKNVVTVLAKAEHYWQFHRGFFAKMFIYLTGGADIKKFAFN